MKKIDIVITTLNELELCNEEQNVIMNIDDANKVLEIAYNVSQEKILKCQLN